MAFARSTRATRRDVTTLFYPHLSHLDTWFGRYSGSASARVRVSTTSWRPALPREGKRTADRHLAWPRSNTDSTSGVGATIASVADELILVAGATGNTGSALLEQLATRGARVRAMVRGRHQHLPLPDTSMTSDALTASIAELGR